MIRLKTEEELEWMRKGGKILAGVMEIMEKMIRPGLSTAELEKEACRVIKEAGGRPSFKNYKLGRKLFFPTALCVSINNEVVHAPSLPARTLVEGDIVAVDMGMEYPLNLEKEKRNPHSPAGGYYTDMTKTFLVGQVSSEAARLVAVAKKALEIGIEKANIGNTLNDIGKTIQAYVEGQGFSVVRDFVGHGVGHSAHEAPQLAHYNLPGDREAKTVLEAGMVLAIEPMVNQGRYEIDSADDNFTFVTADGSLSAQFEHTVAITKNGPVILTLP